MLTRLKTPARLLTATLATSLLIGTIGCGGNANIPATGAPASSSDGESYSSDYAAESAGAATPAALTSGSSESPSMHKSAPVSEGVARMESHAHEEMRAPKKAEAEAEFRPSNNRQSGLLTAGSFDDVANFNDYQSFLRRSGRIHQLNQCRLPVNLNSRRTLISIKDGQGRPLGNVRCVVSNPQNQAVLLDSRTGTDGRTMLFTDAALSHPQQAANLDLKIFTDEQTCVEKRLTVGEQWNVQLDNSESTLPKQLDLAIVVDTTGSMGDELKYLKTEIDSIADTVHQMFPDVKQRYSLITYRDKGDAYVCRTLDFTESLSDFRRKLDAESAGGGGDFPEAMDVALQAANQLSWRDGNTARVMFLVGDAPPHTDRIPAALQETLQLQKKGVRMFPVGASGVEMSAQMVMRTASLLTMGQYLFLTDHSGVGNAHATPSVPEYAVERLDRLMVRMIASELAGKRLVAEEVIAIERGEGYTYAPCVPVPQLSYCEPVIARCSILPMPRSSFWGDLSDFAADYMMAIGVAMIAGVFVFDRLAKQLG